VIVGSIAQPGPSTLISRDVDIRIEDPQRFVSRGGDKLDGALRDLRIQVSGKRWLDAGASTGGFTDRLLQGGSEHVIAVDVGYGQLAWELRNDPRVTVLERTNVRDLKVGALPFQPEGVVADLSFISLRTALPALASVALPNADLLVLVKPQFEIGKGSVGKGGVVREPGLWKEALRGVASAAEGLGFGVLAACVAEPPGPAGNREFFLHLRRGEDSDMESLDAAVEAAQR
jgi:23S rRNA (cytidine1920-2'-O)/16S rRNA (cytidine1409-2'-O)-methyltransferase